MSPVALCAIAFALYILVHNPSVTVLGDTVIRGIVLFGLGVSVLRLSWLHWSRPVVLDGVVIIAAFVVAIALGQALAYLGGGDPTLLFLILSALTAFIPAAYFVATWIAPDGEGLQRTLRLLAIIALVVAMSVVLEFAVPASRPYLSALVEKPRLQGSFRVSGLSSAAGDGLSLLQCLGAMAAFHLAVTSRRTAMRVAWLGVVAFVMAAMVFIGRTGMVLFAVFVLSYLMRFRLAARSARAIAMIGACYVLLLGMVVVILPYELTKLLFERVLPHALEFVEAYLSGGGLRTSSTDDLMSMLFLPEDTRTMLIGSGYFDHPLNPDTNFMGTDIGYIRLIFYVGLIGSAALYVWYAMLWLRLRNLAASEDVRAFVDGLLLVLFVAHLKLSFLTYGAVVAVCFLLYFVMMLDRHRCA